MDLRVSTCFVMLTYCFWCGDAGPREVYQELTVTNGGPWGSWGQRQVCSSGFAKGFDMKVEEYQGSLSWHDDTGLNAIRLYCSNGQTITSSIGNWGTWRKVENCPRGHLISFSLQVQPFQGIVKDDTWANNIRFVCSGGNVLEGHGHNWGKFGEWSHTCVSGAICGLQTKIQPPMGLHYDDAALNDVIFVCCD